MALETGTYISDLVSSNPAGTDTLDKADDHLRLIKSTVQATFPNIAGAVTPTHTELNYVDGVTSAIQTQLNAKSPIASPTFTGTPAAPTAAVDTNTTQIATTAYVVGQGYAKLASPALTGTPTAPTAAVDTNTTQVASTAYVVGQGYLKSSTASSTYAPLASPALTGTPTAPTATGGTNTTQIATTAFVQSAVSGSSSVTLLGTISTTSGNSVTLSSINLTGCKFVYAICDGVDPTTLGTTATFSLGGAVIDVGTTPKDTFVIFDLALSLAIVHGSGGTSFDASTLTTASTSITATTSAPNFGAGSIRLYSVR